MHMLQNRNGKRVNVSRRGAFIVNFSDRILRRCFVAGILLSLKKQRNQSVAKSVKQFDNAIGKFKVIVIIQSLGIDCFSLFVFKFA